MERRVEELERRVKQLEREVTDARDLVEAMSHLDVAPPVGLDAL